MTKLNEVYKCSVCGNIIEVIHASAGTLVCCNKPMVLLAENTVDASKEKHIPEMEIHDDIVKIKVGSVPHPMEEKHYIEFIEVVAGDKVYRKYLHPGDAPTAEFIIKEDILFVREYCNLHGLWKK